MLARLERRLLFRPERELSSSPAALALEHEEVHIDTEDGERLHGWWLPGTGGPTILYCHGNAGNISHRLEKGAFLQRAGFSLLLFDYRGFGQSSGSPSEEGLARDARAAHAYLIAGRHAVPEALVLWGKSLGGSVAARLAGERPAAALVLEASFTSVAELGPHAVPWLGFASRLLRSDFDTARAAAATLLPKLIIHGCADRTVPFWMGEKLHARAAEPKQFLAVPCAGHIDAWQQGGDRYLDTVTRFIRTSLAKARRR